MIVISARSHLTANGLVMLVNWGANSGQPRRTTGRPSHDPVEQGPAWNTGKKLGATRPLKPKEIWEIRFRLDRNRRLRPGPGSALLYRRYRASPLIQSAIAWSSSGVWACCLATLAKRLSATSVPGLMGWSNLTPQRRPADQATVAKVSMFSHLKITSLPTLGRFMPSRHAPRDDTSSKLMRRLPLCASTVAGSTMSARGSVRLPRRSGSFLRALFLRSGFGAVIARR